VSGWGSVCVLGGGGLSGRGVSRRVGDCVCKCVYVCVCVCLSVCVCVCVCVCVSTSTADVKNLSTYVTADFARTCSQL
jgi:hypothetical protein